MNQFFQVWPTSAIQTPCVCTWSEGVFCFRKKPVRTWNNHPIHSLLHHQCVFVFFKNLCCKTMWPRLKCQISRLNMINFLVDYEHTELSYVKENSCTTGSPWQHVFLQSNESSCNFTFHPPVKEKVSPKKTLSMECFCSSTLQKSSKTTRYIHHLFYHSCRVMESELQ